MSKLQDIVTPQPEETDFFFVLQKIRTVVEFVNSGTPHMVTPVAVTLSA